MGILMWILFGLVAGAIAKWLHRGPDPGGWIVTIIIGILGSFLGGWVMSLITSNPNWLQANWSFAGIISAVLGAVILLALYRMLTSRRN